MVKLKIKLKPFEKIKNKFFSSFPGTLYPTIPNPTSLDIQEEMGIEEIYKSSVELKSRKYDYDKFLREKSEEYKNCNLKINEKVYEFWKKRLLDLNEI